jgi:ferredoxin
MCRVATRVSVDPDLCVGTAECVRIAPAAFRIDEARGVSVPQPAATTTDRRRLEEAAFACPTRAISVADE